MRFLGNPFSSVGQIHMHESPQKCDLKIIIELRQVRSNKHDTLQFTTLRLPLCHAWTSSEAFTFFKFSLIPKSVMKTDDKTIQT